MADFLEPEDFLKLIDIAPLVSIDLLVTDRSRKLLVGMRKNRPALGCWFVPGGRIRKGQCLADALSQISIRELGIELDYSAAQLVGAYTHMYDENFAGKPGITTHYIVLAYMVRLDLDLTELPTEQHSDYRWIESENAIDADFGIVHENVIPYFDAIGKYSSRL